MRVTFYLLALFATLCFIAFYALAVSPDGVLKPSLLSHQFTPLQLNYFKDVGFGYPDKVKRWNKDILVQCDPFMPAEDKKEVIKIIAEVKRYIHPLLIKLVTSGGNLFINYPSTGEEFNRYHKGGGEGALGYTQPSFDKFTFFSSVDDITIYISPGFRAPGRHRTLRHEFCHALGLWGHSSTLYTEPNLLGKTIINDLATLEKLDNEPSFIPPIDIAAIKLLYHPAIPNGTSRNDFVKVLSQIN